MRTLVRSDNFFSKAIGLLLFISASFVDVGAVPQSGLPFVTKVEPPSWWARHSVNPVRLLVRGKNLNGARVRATNPAISCSNIVVNNDGTYLFVNVRIALTVRPGTYPMVVETARGKATIPFAINLPLSDLGHFQGITTDDLIYLIMPDRFADGDHTNNAAPDAPATANDRKNPRAYHGGDFRGIINNLQYFKDLGVTALWLTPWYDNWNGVNNCNNPWCPNTYYHGYHAIDYYGVEDRFGDMETLRELVNRAHMMGLKVIQDQVANHVGSRHPWVNNPPLEDWFHGTLAKHPLNKFQNSVLLSPDANREEVRNILDGWFNDDLPDMNQEQPEVARYEIQNALWWVGMTGIDGIRQDTIQYMPRSFIRDLSDALHQQYPKLWMVGEVFERDAAQTAFFIGGHKGWDGIDTKLDSVFDFSLWNTSLLVFTNKLPVRALRDQLKYDALYPDAGKIITLLNNHDTARFISLAGGTLAGAMLHTAFTLSVRGIPQLYYGEEIAMEGKDDPDNRRDFPGGFPGDSRSAFDARGRTPTEQRMYEWTRDWIRLRAGHSAIRHGRLIDRFYDDDAYVFARRDEKETVIIAINRAAQERTIEILAGSIDLMDGSQLAPLVGTSRPARVANGKAALTVAAQTAVAFKLL